MSIPFQALACPLDGTPLRREVARWCCASGHSFDTAAQGYSNLLSVQHKRSRDPGDSKEMIAARARFLLAGHYLPIAQAVGQAANCALVANGPTTCLDAGCGEGYYLRQLDTTEVPDAWSLVGLDISKWAVMAAAKQRKNVTWLVGTNAHLPIQENSLDVILCMFGFPTYGEFARTLKPNGWLIQVDSGVDHLRELRDIIYPSLKPASADTEIVAPGFVHRHTENVRFQLALDKQQDIADLLIMTPHFYRATSEGRERAAALTRLDLTIDVNVTQFQLNETGACA